MKFNLAVTFLLGVLLYTGFAMADGASGTSMESATDCADDAVRQRALPVLLEDDDSIGDDEWVTRLIQLRNAEAAMIIPVLRPLVRRQGHLVAHPPANAIILVDRYANVRRLVTLMHELDSMTPPQAE